MSTPAPTNPNTKPADAAQPVTEPSFEQKLHQFWQKNSGAVYAICAIVLLAIIGKGGYDLYARWQNDKIGAEYSAASSSEKLKAFAAAHKDHPLGGVAKLRLADEAYEAGNYTQAIQDYQAAAEILKGSPFMGRARLGVAMAKLQGGQTADAESQFKLIAGDTSLLNAVRAEAAYQLASSAAKEGRNEEASQFLDQVEKIDPNSVWAQRSMILRRTTLAPVVVAPAAAPSVGIPAKP